MAAKLLLHSLADDNPDLQKQIGCMTGIFQLFDRQHVISGRRITPKRFPPPPPGSSEFNNITHDQEFNSVYRRQTADEMNYFKSQNEKQRVSTESSRASFSSSCSSSLSSLECSRTTQHDVSSFDRMIFPETPSRDPTISQSSTSRQSLDLKDVVKDSMYREIRSLSVKTASNEDSLPVKHRDSPRPVDLKESLKVLAKLREAPWHYNEYEPKDSIGSVPREGRRFSYDGREREREREGNRFSSFESRETIKSTPKLRELPRLSLDGRQSSILDSRSNLKAAHFVNDEGPSLSNVNFDDKVRLSQKKPPSVVAKLMGLEALPDSPSDGVSCSVPVKRNEPMLPIRGFKPGMKEPTSPRWRNGDGSMKTVLKTPNEPAPWKQMDGNRGLQNRGTAKPLKVPLKPVNASVYGEIEKRLKDLEFKQSGKDLRALKQILEAIQSKGLLETRKEEQPTNFAAHKNARLDIQPNVEGSSRFESPIVIMKPAKLVERQGLRSSSVVAIDSLSNLQKLQGSAGRGKIQSPRNNNHQIDNKKSSGRSSSRSVVTQSSAKPQSSSSSVKNTGSSVSPRLQQRKLELEKRSRPPTPPSDPSKPRRQLGRHQTAESSSPGGRSRPKLPNSRPSEDQLSEASNESKAPSLQGDDSDSNTIPDLKIDGELITNFEQPTQKSTLRLGEDEQLSELASRGGAAEHRSPVSVLDVSEYTDDASSPVKEEPSSLKDEIDRGSTYDHVGENWALPQTSAATTPFTSEINLKKLQNIDQLVQKLTRLNSTHNEESTDYIASLCENETNPDHRYISEILLASGLLLRDLTCTSMPFQLHPSGHPINPELFCVLEQTKAWSKPKTEKIQRRFIFDAVNEILVGKLTSAGIIAEPRVRPERVAKQTITAQKLLKELCFEIEQLESKKNQPDEVVSEEEEDSLKVVLWEDVMNRSDKWTDFHADASGIVLDIERLIFKDLVNEVLSGGVRARPPSRRRQLFAK